MINTPHSIETFPIWIPYFWVSPASNAEVLANSMDERVRIINNGNVLYMPQRQIELNCDFDVSLFPFDSHRCVPHFESRRYSKDYQRFHPHLFEYSNFKEHGHWMVEIGDFYEVEPQYPTGTFSAVDFVIVIKRKALYYSISLISIAESATFFLPMHSHDRLQLSFTTLLAFSFFSSTILSELPHDSENMPIILIIINIYTAAIAIVIMFQAFSIFYSERNKRKVANLCNCLTILFFSLTLTIGTLIFAVVLPIMSS